MHKLYNATRLRLHAPLNEPRAPVGKHALALLIIGSVNPNLQQSHQ